MRLFLLVFALFGALLSSCSNDTEKHIIVVRIPVHAMQSLDPSQWVPQTVLAQGTLFEGLVGYDTNLKVVPKIAKSWEVSDDKLTWTFHLRTDKKWSNGDKVTAFDFTYGWAHFCEPGRVTPMWSGMFPDVLNAESYKSGSARLDEVGFLAINDSTLKITLHVPVDILPKLVMGSAMPLHKASYEKAKKDKKEWWSPGLFVGNGPYIPTSFIPDGELVLEKNPHYVGERGNVDQFILRSGGLAVQVKNYEAGDLDIAHVLTLGDYKYSTTGHLKTELVEENEFGFHGIQVARTLNPLMQNSKIRQAISLAIDRKSIAQSVMGGRVVPTTVFGPPNDSVLKNLKGPEYNPDSARRLLKESGYFTDRLPIYIFAPPATDPRGWASVTESVQAQWKEIGLNVIIENMEDGLLNSYAWGEVYPDNPDYYRPGVTMFTGKILWTDPTMSLRLTDHTWLYHNFPYETKVKIQKLNLQMSDWSNSTKGELLQHWLILDTLSQKLARIQEKLVNNENHPALKKELAEPNVLINYNKFKSKWMQAQTEEDRKSNWMSVASFLNGFEVRMHKMTDNIENVSGNRDLADLRIAASGSGNDLVRKLQQQALNQAWIIPIYSEKIVYLKRPWVKSTTMNKFGMWLEPFNLQHIVVDTAMYWKMH